MLQSNRIDGKVNYPKRYKKRINRLKPFSGGEWDIKELGEVKDLIRVYLLKLQDECCAYCGLKLQETSGSEIEHIAPKGGKVRPKHVQFTFTPHNLVLSCRLCNSPTKKGTKDTITTLNQNYKLCEFSIVHPYFDNPADHLEWVQNGFKILISHKTNKGKRTIDIFGLDSTRLSEARAKLLRHEFEKSTPEYEQILAAALAYRGLR